MSKRNTRTQQQSVPSAYVGPRFRTILMDPPWPGQVPRSIYKSMRLKQIRDMPIADLAEDDAHLWLWTVNGLQPEAHAIIESYGFTFRKEVPWWKGRPGRPTAYGMSDHEPLLFATRGKAEFHDRSVMTSIYSPRLENSEKPDEQFSLIHRASSGPAIELFARRFPPSWIVRDGGEYEWRVWGDQAPVTSAEQTVRIPGYPVPSDALFDTPAPGAVAPDEESEHGAA
ncbi:MT-A70 family methyltransferase [Pseudoclavibacter sp. CFCC 11306]|uniref:MT-A70 family methyltransferase n=1 Tax=Pseudoclavibacter sp. CFCC 11306 TaxID=1564493 RepID=UPI0013010620|nr:MT-A70 family methyltransferase [Pseudoclavibacter sp. CFCC 11306]KAB1658168.1 methyltransferase [Pseudoclavibacter sp. CFCC 11306]